MITKTLISWCFRELNWGRRLSLQDEHIHSTTTKCHLHYRAVKQANCKLRKSSQVICFMELNMIVLTTCDLHAGSTCKTFHVESMSTAL